MMHDSCTQWTRAMRWSLAYECVLTQSREGGIIQARMMQYFDSRSFLTPALSPLRSFSSNIRSFNHKKILSRPESLVSVRFRTLVKNRGREKTLYTFPTLKVEKGPFYFLERDKKGSRQSVSRLLPISGEGGNPLCFGSPWNEFPFF